MKEEIILINISREWRPKRRKTWENREFPFIFFFFFCEWRFCDIRRSGNVKGEVPLLPTLNAFTMLIYIRRDGTEGMFVPSKRWNWKCMSLVSHLTPELLATQLQGRLQVSFRLKIKVRDGLHCLWKTWWYLKKNPLLTWAIATAFKSQIRRGKKKGLADASISSNFRDNTPIYQFFFSFSSKRFK